ncbi:MAG: FmdB family zinc ribbon protein [Anaerolineae bacterium]
MPVYEYYCANCELRFEALRPMSQSDTPIACPRCQAPDARKVISVFVAISRDGGSSRLVASSSTASCATCSSGQCATCGSR